jgi:hypothetical protein
MDGLRVSRQRVLRLMRQHALLSPHRARARPETSHERHIITEAPNVMWATDATQVTTVQDGKVWLFGVAEHWNAELLGWHVPSTAAASRPSRPSAWRCGSGSATSAPAPPAAWRSATTTAATHMGRAVNSSISMSWHDLRQHVQTVSRFEPVCVLAFPSQDKLTFGRRTRWPHQGPAYGG